MEPLLLALVALASARTTRVALYDDVGRPFRLAVLHAAERAALYTGRRSILVHASTLLNCPWCLGWWSAVAWTGLALAVPPRILFWLALPWALSYVTGFLDAWADGPAYPEDDA